jgi:hypothetical protein
MSVTVLSQKGNCFTLEICVEPGKNFLTTEETIQDTVNQIGNLLTSQALKPYDTDGQAISVNSEKLTSKGLHHKVYQSPFGPIEVDRHIYQSNRGGETFCPLEKGAGIVLTFTPKFAKSVASKVSGANTREVIRDLRENHGRTIALSHAQKIVDFVGSMAQAADEAWTYETPKPEVPVKTVVIGLDGAHMLMVQDGWRQAMTGTIALYDRHGERLHTTYIGASPEFGRETFLRRMEKEISTVKKEFPRALFMGLADGAPTNWDFLEKHTELQLLDFFHATEYLAGVAEVAFPKDKKGREDWLHKACHRMKHDLGGAKTNVKMISTLQNSRSFKKEAHEVFDGAVTYFRNNLPRMNYYLHTSCHRPIGSGVTEAACKVIIKQRLCGSGMRWKSEGAGAIISLRCLNQSDGRWEQFWGKSQEVGYPDGWNGTS